MTLISPDRKALARKLRTKGLSIGAIASELGHSTASVHAWVKDIVPGGQFKPQADCDMDDCLSVSQGIADDGALLRLRQQRDRTKLETEIEDLEAKRTSLRKRLDDLETQVDALANVVRIGLVVLAYRVLSVRFKDKEAMKEAEAWVDKLFADFLDGDLGR